MKIIGSLFNKNQSSASTANDEEQYSIDSDKPLTSNLESNIQNIKKTLGNSSDIVIRDFQAGKNDETRICIIFTDGLTDDTLISDFILSSLMLDIRKAENPNGLCAKEISLETIKKTALPVAEIIDISNFNDLFTQLLSGDTILLMEGSAEGIAIDSRGWADRGINEPTSESVVRGPQDSFTETLRTNTALLRRRIRDQNLWIEAKSVGRRSKTDIAIAYIKGVASDAVIEEVHKRLDKIDIDGVLEGGYLEESIQDPYFTPFPTIASTERPDKAAAGLLEGRVAVIVDGTPFVLILPVVFIQFFQASEDYYQHFTLTSLIRVLRFFCFFLAILVPSFYIAIVTFHQEMVPTVLITRIASQREGVPFPAAVEALLMEVTFEILREAGLRLPKTVGSAVSIVGGLVLGEAAVQAGIVSPIMVIVIAVTALSNFAIPAFNMALTLRLIRFLFILLSASFGLFGIVLGLITLVLHLCSINSFGVPYMSPMGPFTIEEQRDALIRFPRLGLLKRPRYISQDDSSIRAKKENK